MIFILEKNVYITKPITTRSDYSGNYLISAIICGVRWHRETEGMPSTPFRSILLVRTIQNSTLSKRENTCPLLFFYRLEVVSCTVDSPRHMYRDACAFCSSFVLWIFSVSLLSGSPVYRGLYLSEHSGFMKQKSQII